MLACHTHKYNKWLQLSTHIHSTEYLIQILYLQMKSFDVNSRLFKWRVECSVRRMSADLRLQWNKITWKYTTSNALEIDDVSTQISKASLHLISAICQHNSIKIVTFACIHRRHYSVNIIIQFNFVYKRN